MSTNSFTSNNDPSPLVGQQNQLCREFKKTLSFVEFVDYDDDSDLDDLPQREPRRPNNISDSPSTPPSNTAVFHFPKSVAKTIKFQHHSRHNDEVTTSRFDDEFEILGQLGGGSFGTVFKVKKRLDGCMYAVKVVNQPVQGKSGRERVLKEVYALAALMNNSDNLHIVRYFSSWIDVDDKLYIQTELCDMSLEELLRIRNQQESPPSDSELEQVACEILRQLLSGLRALHGSNVVHLDIKPANILVKSGTYKLGDLGHVAMAKVTQPVDTLPAPPPLINNNNNSDFMDLDAEEDTQQISAVFSVIQDVDEGDVRYMARELLNENRDHLPKADIFSLAASVYEMFLHSPLPSNGEEWAALREGHLSPDATSKMSQNFKQLIQSMMNPDPAKRPSAEALLKTGGSGGILLGPEQLGRDRLIREVEHLRGLGKIYPNVIVIYDSVKHSP